jgi:hypothetical protein
VPDRLSTTTVIATFGEGGATFTGGLAWSLTMDCGTTRTFTLESNGAVLGGTWLVKWPRECKGRHPTVIVNLRPSWMSCDPVNRWSKQIEAGEELRVPITCSEPPPEGS